MESITFQYPDWYLLFCILLGLLFASVLYFRDSTFKDASAWLRRGLFLLRFLTVSIIALLLLEPLLKQLITETKSPVIVLAQDQSESVGASMDESQRKAYQESVEELVNQLSKKYEVKTYSLGEKVQEGIGWQWTDRLSNISEMLRYTADLYSNQNLGAVILASDGIYNEGSNPLYAGVKLEAPVYTIGLGDTTLKRDLYLKRIFNNKIVYLGDRFSIQVDVAAVNCAGSKTNLLIQKMDGERTQTLQQIPVNIEKNDFFTTREIILTAERSGVQRYRIALSGIEGEVTAANNVKDIFVDVLDARQKIVLIANSPHPDLAAIKQSLERSKNYEVTVAYAQDLKVDLRTFDFAVLHQLPSATNPGTNIFRILNEQKTPRLFVAGLQTDFSRFNQIQKVVEIRADGQSVNEVQATVAPEFNFFTISENMKSALPRFSPITTAFGDFSLQSDAQVLLYQRIGKVDTKYPLLAMGDQDGIRTGVFCGEGLFRWRLFDYLQNSNQEIFNEVLAKTTQYLSLKEDKRKFRVTLAKNIFNENEPIVFDAELYNDNFELINEPDATLVIKNSSGNEFPFTFNKSGNTYSLSAGIFPVDNYTFRASTSSSGRQYTFDGQFSVQPIQLELFETTANHGLLRLLSESYGGQMLLPGQMGTLPQLLENRGSVKPILYATTKTRSVIHLKWIFFLLFFLLASEWFLRRYFGAY